MDVLFLMSIFRFYSGLKLSFENNSVCKNLFLSAGFCWDSRLSLREIDQNINLVEPLFMGTQTWNFFRHFNVFRLHAILHDAAGAVRARSGKGPGYCYMIGRGPNSCLLGHVTGLLFCLYVRLFLPSIFNFIDFWSGMSCIALNFELADKSDIKELGVFIDGKVKGYPFRPPEKYKPTLQAFWCTRNLHGIVWNSERLVYSELSNILPSAVKGEHLAKGTEKSKILGNILDKEVENLEDHGCRKVQDLVDEAMWLCSSYPFRHKTTLHCAECKAKMFASWIMHHLML